MDEIINEKYRHQLNEQRSTQALILAALDEEDEDLYWEIVNTLRRRGTREEFEAALNLCKSECSSKKRLGAEILGQLGGQQKPFIHESLAILYELMQRDEDPGVIESAAVAVGFLYPDDNQAVELMAALKDHPNADVRFGAAVGLGGYESDLAITALIALSSDEDAEVRDYATLGLSEMTDLDTPEIREALWQRANDTDVSVRAQALLGLALRKDEKVVEFILRELQPNGQMKAAAVYAAKEIGSPILCKALTALRGDLDVSAQSVEDAISACKCREP